MGMNYHKIQLDCCLPGNRSRIELPDEWIAEFSGDIGYVLGILIPDQMPWKECNHMDKRLRFVVKLFEGEKIVAIVVRADSSI